MAVLRGIPAVFIVTILSQCVVSLNDFVTLPSAGNLKELVSSLVPEVHTLNCINETLRYDDYEMFPNSTLYVTKYHVHLNSSAYAWNNDTITICKPPLIILLDKFTVAFYFQIVIFMTHAQIPIAFCFANHARLFLIFVWCMPVATLFATSISGTVLEFADVCKIIFSVLSFINVSTFGWMSFLSSTYIIRFLEIRRSIEITESKVILKKLTNVANVGLFVGAIISFHSFIIIMYAVSKEIHGIGLTIEGFARDKILLLFAPPIMLFLMLNLGADVFCAHVYGTIPEIVNGIRRDIRLRHHKYFLCYMASISMWCLGCYALMSDYCAMWYCFVVVNTMLPAFWVSELFSLKFFTYDIAEDYSDEDGGYTVLFKFGKKVVKLPRERLCLKN